MHHFQNYTICNVWLRCPYGFQQRHYRGIAIESEKAGWLVYKEPYLKNESGELRKIDLIFSRDDISLVLDMTVRLYWTQSVEELIKGTIQLEEKYRAEKRINMLIASHILSKTNRQISDKRRDLSKKVMPPQKGNSTLKSYLESPNELPKLTTGLNN